MLFGLVTSNGTPQRSVANHENDLNHVDYLIAENQSSTLEKIAQLQHIQFLIEQQPVQRRNLITKLTRHLVR